jgi:cytochrome P450
MSAAPVVVGYDHLDPAFQTDPYPTWARMAQVGPVHRWDEVDAWVVVGHDAARAVLRDGEHYSPSRRYWKHHAPRDGDAGPRTQIEKVEDHGLFHVGADEHVRLRRLVSRAFTPASIEALAPRIQARVDGHLDRVERLAPRHEVDLVTELARTIPVEVIADYLGLSETHAAWFRERVDPVLLTTNPFLTPGDLDQAEQALAEIEVFLEDRFAERRAQTGDDLLSRLLAVEDEGERLSHSELFSLVVTLLLAGAETTSHLISLGTATLLEHPDQLARLRAEPDRWPSAIEELLRWSYIGYGVARFTRTAVAIPTGPEAVVDIPAGELVFVSIGAALRDASLDAAGQLDVTRIDSSGPPAARLETLAFGIGTHYCLGAALARLEGRIVLTSLFDRWPTLAFAGPPVHLDHFILRGLASLPVRW